MNKNEKTILSLESDNKKFSAELSWAAGMDEILQAFFGLCVSASFMPETVITGMKEFSESMMYNKEI